MRISIYLVYVCNSLRPERADHADIEYSDSYMLIPRLVARNQVLLVIGSLLAVESDYMSGCYWPRPAAWLTLDRQTAIDPIQPVANLLFMTLDSDIGNVLRSLIEDNGSDDYCVKATIVV
ncbi:MAG: hypothetical protein AAFY56_07965, partial [Pseudomonadota bacterium]